MDLSAIITTNPNIRFGKPCVRGMRYAVRDVLEWLAAGMTIEEILEDYPDLNRDDIYACLAYAAQNLPRSVGLVGAIIESK